MNNKFLGDAHHLINVKAHKIEIALLCLLEMVFVISEKPIS